MNKPLPLFYLKIIILQPLKSQYIANSLTSHPVRKLCDWFELKQKKENNSKFQTIVSEKGGNPFNRLVEMLKSLLAYISEYSTW